MGKRSRNEEGQSADRVEERTAKKVFPSHVKNKFIRSLQYSKLKVEKKKSKKLRRNIRDTAEAQALELGETVRLSFKEERVLIFVLYAYIF